jgi:urease accessory protein
VIPTSPAGPALIRLLTWLSPAFPVGGYTYSHGLEYAVEAGLVRTAGDLAAWLATLVGHGAGRVDATLLCAAWRAADRDDPAALGEVAELADAMRGTAETALESAAQGRAFLDTVRRVWPDPWLERWTADLAADGREPAYAVAVGVAAARAGVPLEPAVQAYLHALAAGLVSAAVRLVPLGQTDGQRALAALEPAVLAAAAAALERPLAGIGSATPMVEWASMLHETQYTRLFRS